MPALQREAAWAEERLSGVRPKNGRAHLHIVEMTVRCHSAGPDDKLIPERIRQNNCNFTEMIAKLNRNRSILELYGGVQHCKLVQISKVLIPSRLFCLQFAIALSQTAMGSPSATSHKRTRPALGVSHLKNHSHKTELLQQHVPQASLIIRNTRGSRRCSSGWLHGSTSFLASSGSLS